MLPVLGGEVEERQQHVGVLLQRHQGLRVLRTILDREPPDGLAHLRAGLGVHHLAQRGLHAQLEALRELIEDVAELVEQSRCSRVLGQTLGFWAAVRDAASPAARPIPG